MENLYVVEDENYRMIVKANNWKEAKQKACDYHRMAKGNRAFLS